jgi:hypothetical protein
MTETINYKLFKDDEEHTITITPVNQNIPGGDIYVTGVFRLTEGHVGMGDIVFDDEMKQWEYSGMGDLNHQDAAEIAVFIQAKNAIRTNHSNI